MQQEHTQAESSRAVDRYLLDEMTEAERHSFEEHFADCRVCAADVRAGMQMMAAGKAVAAEEPRSIAPMWLAPVAASLVGILIGWQGAMRMVAPRVVPMLAIVEPVDVLTDQDRAATDEAPPQLGEEGHMVVWITASDAAASYQIRVAGPANVTVPPPVSVTRAQAEDPVQLKLRGLPRGSYQLVIEGVGRDGRRFPIESKAFNVVDEQRGVR